MRKIILEGQLGQKFGTSHVFWGETPAEAIRLIGANYPEFRKYLIECHEKDIGFHIEVNKQEVDLIECLLPLSTGDIVITPVPSGSKSGGAKILAAVAIVGIMIAMPGSFGALMQGTAFGAQAGSTAAFLQASAAYTALGVAVNLALVGLQQLMAPDPATDQKNDEGYLFTGEATNIVEGDPVPVLYGELRVPGIPVSVEVLPNTKETNNYSNHYTDANNNTYSQKAEAEAMLALYEMRQATDSMQTGVGLSVNSTSIAGKSQNIVATHVISEGPIQGLVNGASSVYLNSDRALDPVDSNSGVNAKTSFTNGSTAGTISNFNSTHETSTEDGASARAHIVDYATGSGTVDYSYIAVPDGFGGYNSLSELKLVSSTSVFTSAMQYDSAQSVNTLVKILNSAGDVIYQDVITKYTSGTTVSLGWGGSPLSLTHGDTYSFAIDYAEDIEVDSSGNATLGNNFGGTSGDYEVRIGGTQESPDAGDNFFTAAKYKNFGVQFRTGHLYQTPLKSVNGSGSGNTAITTALNNAIVGPGNTGTDSYTYNTTILGLSAAQAAEADEVRFLISYGQLINYKGNGEEHQGKAWYKIEIRFTNDGTNFTAWQTLNPSKKHYATTASTITFPETINLEQLRPAGAIDWEVKITRLSDNDKAYENTLAEGINPKYTGQSAATIVSATTTIKELLSYPLTAVARTQFNSQDFSGLPTIGYQCRGLKVKVPSNYVTREEASDGVAAYKRNTSTGAIESTYQNWDGNFRSQKVYTNNPAWVFYDIIINNRYGLGSYLSESDIDKYALYRIARYCDELVDDGNGGLEPRFTTNVWLTKATDAYKILKDLSTVFRGMLYWLDGEVVGIIDQASDAVYNFSSSNVIDGQFNYESTGSKTRVNQVAVTWNNPLSDFKPEALLVEDGENIAKTGKIIQESAVAFGATSEGQALRYGRWKLWTAKNQTEVVSFATGINAAFLRPGDIVNIQDPYKHPPYQTLSGRISSSGTRTTTVIPLDREITLQADSTYELNVLIQEAGAFLSQDSATISGVSYTVGELIPSITTEADASDAVDSVTGEPVQVVWKPYTRVETQTVSTSAGSGITSLTVSSAFTAVPNAQTVWALRRALTASEAEVLGTKQEYKILAISQNDDTTYDITAIKHYNEKFNAVDKNWTLSVEDPVFPPEKADDIVPAPANFYLVPRALDSDSIANDVTLYWDTPLNSDGTEYTKVSSFELYHNLPNVKQNPIYIPGDFNSVGPYEFPTGVTTVTIATISKRGKRSKPKKAFINISGAIQERNVPRIKGVPRGGVSNAPISLSVSNVFEFARTDYTFTPIGAPDVEVLGSSGTATTYSQDVSDIAAISDATWAGYTLTEKLYAAHFILMDSSDTSDPIKLIKWYDDSTLNIGYWYNAGTGNTAASSYWGTATGTISISAQSSKVTGSSTTFTSNFEVGDYIKIGSSDVAKISYIASDTVMYLDRSFSSAVSGGTAYYPTLRIDKNADAIIAGVRNLQTGGFKLIPSPNFTVVADPEVYQGTDGTDGIRQTEGYVYYNTATSSAPTGPGTSATYTWATGAITGMNSGWQQSPPEMLPGTNANYYYARYIVTQSVSTDTTSTPTFGSVTLGHNFSGLVTFSGAQLTDGVSSFDPASKVSNGGTIYDINAYGSSSGTSVSTTIDGDYIRTGTLELSRLVSSTFTSGTHAFALANTGITIDGSSFDTTAVFTSSDTGGTCVASLGIFDVTASYGYGLAGLSRSSSGAGGVFCYDASGSWGANNADSTVTVAQSGYLLQGWSNGTKLMDVSTSGNARFSGNVTAYSSFSDIRLKDDIEVIQGAVTKCMALRGVTFEYKKDKKRATGLIAQEVRRVLPEAVYETQTFENSEDNVLAINYGNMAGLFVEAIKELQGQISELKREVKRLKDGSSN